MLFATAQSLHRVCRGRQCWVVPSRVNLRGLGDAIDDSDPCTLNPSDPVCKAVNSGSGQVPGSCTLDSECPNGYTCNFVSGFCEKSTSNLATDATGSITVALDRLGNWISGGVSAAGPQVKVGQVPTMTPVHGAISKIFSFAGLLTLGVLSAAGYGGYRYYKKHHKR